MRRAAAGFFFFFSSLGITYPLGVGRTQGTGDRRPGGQETRRPEGQETKKPRGQETRDKDKGTKDTQRDRDQETNEADEGQRSRHKQRTESQQTQRQRNTQPHTPEVAGTMLGPAGTRETATYNTLHRLSRHKISLNAVRSSRTGLPAPLALPATRGQLEGVLAFQERFPTPSRPPRRARPHTMPNQKP